MSLPLNHSQNPLKGSLKLSKLPFASSIALRDIVVDVIELSEGALANSLRKVASECHKNPQLSHLNITFLLR